MKSFAEFTKQVHLVKDLILSNMLCGPDDKAEDEAMAFSKRLQAMKSWFARISWANKKRYILALLEDVRSGWTISCLLKSIWNCQPKDAIHSAHERKPWSSYDQVPMDHNRTALPVYTLAQVMKNERFWFISLEPQAQAMVLLELLTLSGGPVMWSVLKRANMLYDRYRNEQLHNLEECIVLDQRNQHSAPSAAEKEKKEKDQDAHDLKQGNTPLAQAQKELEANLAAWSHTIKVMRDSLKLEELEITFKDGTKRKIWKVNRPKPEAVETVDYIQLLPSEIAKRILSYLPHAMLGDCARVNKYWAYLVEEYQIEVATCQKLDANLEKLQELMLHHDTSMDILGPVTQSMVRHTSFGVTSVAPSLKHKSFQSSMKASEKSLGTFSFRHLVGDKLSKPIVAVKPMKNLAELSERLERRGAADENLWSWCDNIIHNRRYQKVKRAAEGVLPQDNTHFPCSKMKVTLDVPLRLPLHKDPAAHTSLKPMKMISNAALNSSHEQPDVKRYNLWTKDFSGLYPVYKIPSHQSPV